MKTRKSIFKEQAQVAAMERELSKKR